MDILNQFMQSLSQLGIIEKNITLNDLCYVLEECRFITPEDKNNFIKAIQYTEASYSNIMEEGMKNDYQKEFEDLKVKVKCIPSEAFCKTFKANAKVLSGYFDYEQSVIQRDQMFDYGLDDLYIWEWIYYYDVLASYKDQTDKKDLLSLTNELMLSVYGVVHVTLERIKDKNMELATNHLSIKLPRRRFRG